MSWSSTHVLFWIIGAPSVQGALPNVQFSFLVAVGFKPTFCHYEVNDID